MTTIFRVQSALAAIAMAVVCALTLSPSGVSAQTAQIGPGGQKLTLEVNEGQLVRLQRAASSVFIANADIADVRVKSPQLIYLFGKVPGETTLYALDETDNVVTSARIAVSHNISRLNSALEQLLPAGAVTATSVDGGIILTGAVETAAQSEDARRLTARFVGQGEDIINRIAVTQPNQVNLRVRMAEVTKSVVDSLGFSWDAIFDSGQLFFRMTTGTLFLEPGIVHPDGGISANSNTQAGAVDLNNLIDALASDGLVTVLAEPNLTALSGETASFLSGGEFPIPISQDNDITILFKQYGVSLSFTPTILGRDRISMRVRPEVSELTTVGAVTVDGISVPGISTRRAETTIELASGQSFAIAGLRLDSRRQNYNDIPGLGSIPLFGSLFQQNSLETTETEILIVVTPYIVRPVSNELPLPTDPFMGDRQASAGGSANMANVQSQTVPLAEAPASADASTGQTGFILE